MAATFEYFPDVDVFMSNRVLLADRLIQGQSPGFLYLSDYQSVVRRVYFFLLWYGKNLSFLGFFSTSWVDLTMVMTNFHWCNPTDYWYIMIELPRLTNKCFTAVWFSGAFWDLNFHSIVIIKLKVGQSIDKMARREASGFLFHVVVFWTLFFCLCSIINTVDTKGLKTPSQLFKF